MFPGMFMKPDKAAALKQLKAHAVMFAGLVAVIRATPYVLGYLSESRNDDFKLEL